MTSNQEPFDLVILGGGSGGYAAALRAAELGQSVALVEQDLLGGTCLHRGCIPTKALLHAAEIADSARESSQFGVTAELTGIDMPGVHKYKDSVTRKLHKVCSPPPPPFRSKGKHSPADTSCSPPDPNPSRCPV